MKYGAIIPTEEHIGKKVVYPPRKEQGILLDISGGAATYQVIKTGYIVVTETTDLRLMNGHRKRTRPMKKDSTGEKELDR